ncbi:hypothetical protein DEO72_LG3g2203 [Vigna unguiculata]|uniref:Ulp1 protease family n=1 Tax=Vigna unguiculata TaxID=3917 RepID=A0A4D6LHM9_VIGUN|nr:hypothetical protein DEO72_LG3g2203 [Vigna unguiculata]
MGKLYKDVTAAVCTRSIYVDVNGQILRSDDCQCFRPRGWIDNMNAVILDCNKRKVNRRVWCLDDYRHYLTRDLVSVQDILTADFLFAPVIYVEHWWCYAFNYQTKEFFVLDSLAHKCRGRKQIDSHVVQNVEHLFWLFLNDKKQLKPTYEVHIEDVSEQPNFILRYGTASKDLMRKACRLTLMRIYNNSDSSTFVIGFFTQKISIGRRIVNI